MTLAIKVFSTAHMIGALACSAMMWASDGDELIKACIALFYCMVMVVILGIIEYKYKK